MSKPTFTIGVFAIIVDKESRILFCLRNENQKWEIPGGCLDHGEAPWEGVIREVKEETGLDVCVEKMVGIYSRVNHDDLVFQFVCKVTGGEIASSTEADEIRYFAFDDIPQNHNENHIERIEYFLDNPEIINIKTQQN